MASMAAVSTAATAFIAAGRDFIDKAYFGTEDIWWILKGQDYPKLRWKLIE